MALCFLCYVVLEESCRCRREKKYYRNRIREGENNSHHYKHEEEIYEEGEYGGGVREIDNDYHN